MQAQDEYQNTAAIYDFLFSRALREIRQNIRTLLTHSKPESVIDLCCGTGEQLRMLGSDDMLLTGVDLSRAMLARARQASPDTIHYLEADAADLPLPDKSFDGVILSLALHEKTVDQQTAIFREACRLLKPDGNIIIADYCTPPAGLASQLMGRIFISAIERAAGLNHYHNYRDWLKNGAVDGFLERENPGKPSLITPHFSGCVKLMVVSRVQEDPVQTILKQQQSDERTETEREQSK